MQIVNHQCTSQQFKEEKKTIVIEQTQLHKYFKGKKTLLCQGPFKITEIKGIITISTQNFSQRLSYPLVISQFTNSKSYVFEGTARQVYSISYSKINLSKNIIQAIQNMQSLLSEHTLLTDFNSQNRFGLDECINKHFPNLKSVELYQVKIEQKGIWNSTKNFFKTTGQTIGNKLNGAFDLYNQKYGQKNQQKWGNFKKKTESWNNGITHLWNPIATKSDQITFGIGQKIKTSQNWGMKALKKISFGTESFLNRTTDRFRKKKNKQESNQNEVRSENPNINKDRQIEDEIRSDKL